jgi:DNA-directed RNA polymerase specialized sigma24 family protein
MVELTDDQIAECEIQIRRESRHWAKRFPGDLKDVREVLYQEGWAIAMKALRSWHPDGGARLGTYLTTALRRRHLDLLQAELKRHRHLLLQVCDDDDDPVVLSDGVVEQTSEACAKVASLTSEERQVAEWLIEEGGSVSGTAKRRGVTVHLLNRFRRQIKPKLQ